MERLVTTIKLSNRFSIQFRDTDKKAEKAGKEVVFLDYKNSKSFYLGIALDEKDAITAATKILELILYNEEEKLILATSLTGVFNDPKYDGFLSYIAAVEDENIEVTLIHVPNHILTFEEIYEMKIAIEKERDLAER